MIFGRLVCFFKGHKRRKLVSADETGAWYQCGRCGQRRFSKRSRKVTPQEEK